MSIFNAIRFRILFWVSIIPNSQKAIYLGVVLLGICILMVKMQILPIFIGVTALSGLLILCYGAILTIIDLVRSFKK